MSNRENTGKCVEIKRHILKQPMSQRRNQQEKKF